MALVAKQQTVSFAKGSFPVGLFGMRGKQVNVGGPIVRGYETFPVVMFYHLEGFPVVHAGPSQVLVGNLEAEWMDKV